MGSCSFISGTNLKAFLVTKFTDNSALEKSHFDFPSYQLNNNQMSMECDLVGHFVLSSYYVSVRQLQQHLLYYSP